MSEKLINIHIPRRKSPIPSEEHIDPGLSGYARPELALAIMEQGADPVFSRGPEAYGSDEEDHYTVKILRPTAIRDARGEYEVTVAPEDVAASSIGVVRNVTSIYPLPAGLPELNDPSIRIMTRDKLLSNKRFRSIGQEKPFASWDGGSLDEAFDHIPGDDVVIKPRVGSRSRGIHIGTKQELFKSYLDGDLSAAVAENRNNPRHKGWIVEPKFDLTLPLPVRAYDEDNQAILTYANENGLPKDIRCMSFGYDEQGAPIRNFIASTTADKYGRSHWIPLDQYSVPDELREADEQVMKCMSEQTGVREAQVAQDWFYVADPDGSGTARFIINEWNGGEPALVERTQHAPTAQLQARLLAAQLIRVAQAGTTK